MVIGTAASMDGYSTYVAAITNDGCKQTMSYSASKAIFPDLDIISTAYHFLTAFGYRDVMEKIIAELIG